MRVKLIVSLERERERELVANNAGLNRGYLERERRGEEEEEKEEEERKKKKRKKERKKEMREWCCGHGNRKRHEQELEVGK